MCRELIQREDSFVKCKENFHSSRGWRADFKSIRVSSLAFAGGGAEGLPREAALEMITNFFMVCGFLPADPGNSQFLSHTERGIAA